jgi:hypothetical protein
VAELGQKGASGQARRSAQAPVCEPDGKLFGDGRSLITRRGRKHLAGPESATTSGDMSEARKHLFGQKSSGPVLSASKVVRRLSGGRGLRRSEPQTCSHSAQRAPFFNH